METSVQVEHAPTKSHPQFYDILIVEDELSIAEFMYDILSDEGFRVKLVHDGAASLEILEHIQPRLVLLDLLLPIRSGFEVMNEYHHRKVRHAPIIAMTANRINPEKVLQAGASALLLKPFELDHLFHLVDQYIDKE